MLTLKTIPVIEGNDKIDGFHLMWDPFLKGHLPLSGYSIWRRKSSGGRDKPVCRLVDGNSLASLHTHFYLFLTSDDIKFKKITFRPMQPRYPGWPAASFTPASRVASPQVMFGYDIFFTEPVFNSHVQVAIKPVVKFLFAVAFKGGRVVRSKFIKDLLSFSFEEPVDKISFYIPAVAESIRVCYTPLDPGKDEEWQLIKKDLCLPFAGFGEDVSTVQQEYDLFRSRLNDDLLPEFNHFENISSLLRNSLGFVKSMLLPATSAMNFMDVQSGNPNNSTKLNAAPFAMLQTFSVYHNWRMGLGFGYLDQKSLEENGVYDYKITANYHNNTRETIYDFHSIPLHTRVGPGFSLNGIFIYSGVRTFIDSFPGGAATSAGTFVKGIRISGAMRIIFPQAITKFAIYCFKEPGATLTVANSSITLPIAERVEIKMGTATENILILGNFAFTGIAFPSIGAGENAREIVTETGYCFNQVYSNTKRLESPSSLEARNIQSAPVPFEKKSPEGLGFNLSWEHPSGYDDAIDPALWPPDCPLPPPAELGYYKLEYMNTSANPVDEWHLHDEQTGDDPTGVVLPSDDYYAAPVPISFGADLLTVFPVTRNAGGTFTSFQRFKHLLENRAGNLVAKPGAFYKYRIWTVDLAGRVSADPVESMPMRLEKRQPPPAPAGLADRYILPNPDPGYTLPDPRTELRPQNVYVNVLQASRPNLTTQERALLGDRDHITILTWTWGEEERSLDQYAKEFRLYIRTHEHGMINGEFTATASAIDQDWNIQVTLSTAVLANEFVNAYVTLQRIVFKIISHDAGTAITIRVAPPQTRPGSIPTAGSFKLFRKPRGEEARPASWTQRIAVVPLSDNFVYQYVLETGSLLSEPGEILGLQNISYEINAVDPNTRCWLGVSAADAEPYVDDQLNVIGDFSPRKGNEGAIVTAPVQAKFYGRPVFNPPAPLEDVEVIPLDEVGSDKLLFSMTPIELLSFLQPTDTLRIERITGTDLLSLLHVNEQSVQLSDAESPSIVNDWILNPADEAELRGAFENSSKPIPAKFIWAISKKNELHFDGLWKTVNAGSISCTNKLMDYLPNRTDRYIYRAKLTNEIGIPSESAALFPAVWRTPDKTIPPGVSITDLQLTEALDEVTVKPVIKMDAGMAGSIKGILVFPGAFATSDNITEDQLNAASLLKIPNRPDFLSEQLYRVRVNRLLVEPIFISLDDADRETIGPSTILTWNSITLNFPFEQTVAIWAAAVSADNILSKLGPYRKIFTGLTPPPIPELIVETNTQGLQISFTTTVADSLLYRIERSEDGEEGEFKPVTGWFVAAAGNNISRFAMPSLTTNWRLKIRNKTNREYAGSPVEYII